MTETAAESGAKSEFVANAMDRPLIDFGDSASSNVGITVSDGAAGKLPPFPNWTTFESTTDLHQASETNAMPSSADAGISQDAGIAADQSDGNCSDSVWPVSGQTDSIKKCNSEIFADDSRHVMISTSTGSVGFDNGAEVDVSDSELLLPVASQTSVSEPCSPAHAMGIDNPHLLVSEDNVCLIDETDSRGLCRSLPADSMSERLSWMTSASCENLIGPMSNRKGLSGRAQFVETLSKASSDSPVYVCGGGNAPPVPPRDYPSCRHQPAPKNHSRETHSEIHPIVQDGQRRSSTHYWLLPEKQPRLDAPPAAHAEPVSYVNIPDSGSGAQGRERSLRRGAKPQKHSTETTAMDDMMKELDISSAASSDQSSMAEVRDKVDLIRAAVGFDAVTFDEGLNALSLSHWSVDDAVRYIKTEHLFRLGIAPRDVCREALVAFQWDVEKAASCLVDRQSIPGDHTH